MEENQTPSDGVFSDENLTPINGENAPQGINGGNPAPMNTARLPLSHAGGLIYSVSAVAMQAVGLVISIIILIFGIEEKTDPYVYLSYLASPIAITASIAFTLKYKKLSFKRMFPVKCHPKYYLIGLLLSFGFLFFVGLIDRPVLEFFKLLGYEERGADAYLPTLTGGWVVLAMLVMAIMPAVFEEALFRGVILNTCEESMGSIRAIFIVGFCFALFHGSPEQTVYQFILGCGFAFMAIRSGSILPTVMMHFINNGLIVLFGALGMYNSAGELVISDTANLVLIILGALSFAGGMLWLILDKKKPMKPCQKGSVKSFFLFASVGIAVMGLIWILSFFI